MCAKQSNRQIRINDEIMRETAIIIRSELKDPRIKTLVSVTKADTTADLKYCKIYISVLGTDEEKQETLEGLKSCSGFIRKELARRINLRNTPELKFVLDDSLDISFRMDELIKKANANNSIEGE